LLKRQIYWHIIIIK